MHKNAAKSAVHKEIKIKRGLNLWPQGDSIIKFNQCMKIILFPPRFDYFHSLNSTHFLKFTSLQIGQSENNYTLLVEYKEYWISIYERVLGGICFFFIRRIFLKVTDDEF